ncbi:MAG TPA: hypothetical protein VMR77_03610 [Patescibacteria group bacterium]|nr:hypothetical protein [Patescibacteria group bacterium]
MATEPQPIDANRPTDFTHGQRVAGMEPERSTSAHYQAQLKPTSNGRSSLGRLWNGLTSRVHDAIEHASSGEKQVVFGEITAINAAKMLAGDRDHSMQTEPFTRSQAFANLGYLGGPVNHPNEYAAMLFAQRELVIAGVLEEQPNPNIEGTYWFKVADPNRLMAVANENPKLDKSLARELTLMSSVEQRRAFVSDFLRRNQVRLDLAA